ncbi:MAG: response regulator [Clostridium sp.]
MIRVIIVEDDPMVRDINAKFLGKVSGFEVVSFAENISNAKQVLKAVEVDLVLLDVFLPDGNGIELLKWIRSEKISVDTILITAENTKNSVNEAFKYGAVDYLIKPFKFSRFEEALLNYKDRVVAFESNEQLNQEGIDEHILKIKGKKENKSSECTYQKGVSAKTYNIIINYLTEVKGEKKTAEEIADGIGLSRVTVRRYLEKMSEEGKVEIIQEYGKIGRPTNFYYMNS